MFKKLFRKIFGRAQRAANEDYFLGVRKQSPPPKKTKAPCKREIHIRRGDYCNTCGRPIEDCEYFKEYKTRK